MLSRRRIIVLAAVLVVAAIVGIGSYLISSNTKQDTSAANPSAPAQIGSYGFPISSLGTGLGGATTAPDGKTRIGYKASCEDATRAALSYITADSYTSKSWPNTKKTLDRVLLPNEDKTRYVEALGESARSGAASTKSLFTPRLFRVISCEAGQSASVSVLVRTESSGMKVDSTVIPSSTEITVINQHLVWHENGWKLDLSSKNASGSDETPLLFNEQHKEPESVEEVIGQVFTDHEGNSISREGWTELEQ